MRASNGALPSKMKKTTTAAKQNVWKTVPRDNLNERKPLGTRWVFKKKYKKDKRIRYKCHIEVKGYVQIPGLDFTDSSAPVAIHVTYGTVCTTLDILYLMV